MTDHHCVTTPKNVFFPRGDGGHNRYRRAVAHAINICQGCPLQIPCYATATRNRETRGIWGGVNFGDRKWPPKQRTYPTGTIVDGGTEPWCGTEAGWSRHARQAANTGGTVTCRPCLDARHQAQRNRNRTQQRKQPAQ